MNTISEERGWPYENTALKRETRDFPIKQKEFWGGWHNVGVHHTHPKFETCNFRNVDSGYHVEPTIR